MNSPVATPAGQNRADGAETKIEKHEQERGAKRKPLGDMPQSVVAHLVAPNENDLGRVHLCDRRIPHHDALRGAESRHVRIQRRRFLRGPHPEHPLGRNVFSGALHHSLEACGQRSVLLRERLELVKQRVNNERIQEEDKQPDRQRREPEIKPPAARGLADCRIEDPDENGRNDDGDDLPLGPIPEPRAPSLYRNSVRPKYPVLGRSQGQLEDVNRQNQRGRKDDGLKKPPGESSFRPGTVFRRQLPTQDQPENRQSVKEADQRARETNPAEVSRLLVAVRGQCVLRDFLRLCLLRLLRLLRDKRSGRGCALRCKGWTNGKSQDKGRKSRYFTPANPSAGKDFSTHGKTLRDSSRLRGGFGGRLYHEGTKTRRTAIFVEVRGQ